jgi:hypothetical protein
MYGARDKRSRKIEGGEFATGQSPADEDTVVTLTDVTKNTATQQSRRWAEYVEVKEILTKRGYIIG